MRDWTKIGIGLDVIAAVLVTIEPTFGIPLVVVGTALIVYGIWPDFVKRLLPFLPSGNDASKEPSCLKKDCQRIFHAGQHLHTHAPWLRDTDFCFRIAQELRQRFVTGELAVFGRKPHFEDSPALEPPLIPIPKQHWEDHTFSDELLHDHPDYLGFPRRVFSKREPGGDGNANDDFWDLHIDMNEVRQLWPEAQISISEVRKVSAGLTLNNQGAATSTTSRTLKPRGVYTGTPRIHSDWLRVTVKNTSPTQPARNCRVYVDDVEIVVKDKDYKKFEQSEMRLCWSMREPPDELIDIEAGGTATADVLCLIEGDTLPILQTARQYIDHDALFSYRGLYRIAVRAVSDEGGAATATILFDWQGNWETAKAELENDGTRQTPEP